MPTKDARYHMTEPNWPHLDVLFKKAVEVLGRRVRQLVPQQEDILISAIQNLLQNWDRDTSKVTADEIEGAWELVTKHVYPASFAVLPENISLGD